ncbi:MAG: spore germination protein GerW family protein [Clostridium sp.]|uniref:GerW family sporulation protein n=1 Tax=Clostridium sp. TaxID=1506 RepID=UPI0039EBA9BD
MENQASLKENLDTLFSNLENFLKTETVVGEPITVGETTLVPIISLSFGCGTGAGNNGDKGAAINGTGLGAAAKVTPNAVIAITGDKVNLLPISGKNNLDSLLNLVPEIVSKFKSKKSDKNHEEAKSSEKNNKASENK